MIKAWDELLRENANDNEILKGGPLPAEQGKHGRGGREGQEEAGAVNTLPRAAGSPRVGAAALIRILALSLNALDQTVRRLGTGLQLKRAHEQGPREQGSPGQAALHGESLPGRAPRRWAQRGQGSRGAPGHTGAAGPEIRALPGHPASPTPGGVQQCLGLLGCPASGMLPQRTGQPPTQKRSHWPQMSAVLTVPLLGVDSGPGRMHPLQCLHAVPTPGTALGTGHSCR